MAWRGGPAGVEEQGMCERVSQEPGRPCRLRRNRPAGGSGDQTQASESRAHDFEERNLSATAVLAEDNQVGREGRQGVGVSDSTEEAGELAP